MYPKRSQQVISVFVILLHAAIILAAFTFSEKKLVSKKSEKLVVKSIALKPIQEPAPVVKEPEPIAEAIPQKRIVPPEPVKTEVPPPKQIEQPKPPPSKPKPKEPAKVKTKEEKKKSAPKPIPAEKPKFTKQQAELVAKAQESMAKINKATAPKTVKETNAKLPSSIAALAIDAMPLDTGTQLNPKEAGYRDELAQRLKLLLTLPEYGEVKIKLTLNKDGTVYKVEIVHTESQKNRFYAEKTLPSLKFTPFGDLFGKDSTYTFLITLRNEI